jgi:hypothetical protein
MNKYEHADNSAIIFGGKSEDYISIHELIDSNKLVTPSIFGRFFLHHLDVGGVILRNIFGEFVGTGKVPIEDILKQHLLEDYGRILTFESDWRPVLEANIKNLPQLRSFQDFLQKAKYDPRLKGVSETYLRALEGYFSLKFLGVEYVKSKDYKYPVVDFAIFGHALGGDLLCKIIGKKKFELYTSDLVFGYLNCRFENPDRFKDPVPTLLDWEKCISDETWMHSPLQRINLDSIKKEIEKLKEEVVPRISFSNDRIPCNLD